ncbi:hypothetical protein [Fluviicola sp.]|uniref:hypothetical protein n=1 Tax=Fluviicola sp. TaxID=1917219 RepID=UPI0031E2FEB5
MKAIKYLVIGGAIVLTGKYLLSLNRAQKKIVIVATGKRGKISAQGISIVIRYNIKNPTKARMTMTPPLIKLSLNGTLIGTSNMQMNDIPADVRDKTGKIIIRAFNETGNIEASVFIPWLNLLTVGGDLIKRFKSTDPKDQITVEVETISQVYSMIGNFPHEETLSIKL